MVGGRGEVAGKRSGGVAEWFSGREILGFALLIPGVVWKRDDDGWAECDFDWEL